MRSIYMLVLIMIAVFVGAGARASAQPRVWNFAVYLDDTRIGHHRYTLREETGMRDISIAARFQVKVLFFEAYRYVHEAREQWRGDCLERLSARTDDNGENLAVDAVAGSGRVTVVAGGSRDALEGCVMSYAYWNPRILRQSRLLNAQTGEYEAIRVSALGNRTITVRGVPVPARHYRISGPRNPIDLWYSADDEWLALEATLAGGRRLSYRLD